MSTDAEPGPAPESASTAPTGAKKKKKKGAKRARPRPLTEPEINAPDRQTLVMLGSLTAMALTLWVLAHAGCNYHPPRETRRPRDVTTAELVHDPKDAAIEFQHRLLTLNLKGALEIAVGPAVAEVNKAQAECDANKTSCAARKKAAAEAITAGVVVDRGPGNASVRVTTYQLPTGNRTNLISVNREGASWRVSSVSADVPAAGAQNAAPVAPSDSAPATGGPSANPVAPTPMPSGHP